MFALFSPLMKDHPSSKTTICVNHRVVSQEGDYCNYNPYIVCNFLSALCSLHTIRDYCILSSKFYRLKLVLLSNPCLTFSVNTVVPLLRDHPVVHTDGGL